MGLLKRLFRNPTPAFDPDFSKTEYDNWLDYLDRGGTTKEWEIIKRENMWVFSPDETKQSMKYQKEIKNISDKYFSLMKEIENDWSVLYNLGDYIGKLSNQFEKKCLEDIAYYEKMREIDIKYGERTPTNIPAFKRLAMLYERRTDYEKSVDICKQAISLGMDERSRMVRMIKKAGRTPTVDEHNIIENINA